MPAATPIDKREEVVQRRNQGASLASIAREMGLAYNTVRNIYKHYEKHGTVRPSYEACGRSGIRKNKAIYTAAIALKKEHPTWGAGLIWVELAETFAESDLPSVRQMQRWFQRAQVASPPKRTEQATPYVRRGQAAHEVWALDAKEEIQLADGTYASWLAITDEGSGAILHTAVFPPETVDNG